MASGSSSIGPSSNQPALNINAIREWLRVKVATRAIVPIEQVDSTQPLDQLGLDSVAAIELSSDLEEWLGIRVSPTLAYDYPTIDAIAAYLSNVLNPNTESAVPTSATFSPEPIAVIGIGCRFPGGANDVETFWEVLQAGRDCITEIPADRWNLDEYYDANPAAAGKMTTRWGGFVDNVDKFDPLFFGISPREAVSMDPQQRLFLEVAWEALENAGLAPDRLSGSPTGVFAAMCAHDYSQLFHRFGSPTQIDAYFGTGNAFSVTPGRISFILGLQGPSVVIDTACSSSLVALHLACQSLRTGESRMALAGAVNLLLSPTAHVNFSKAHMMAADGRCKTFDAAADGYVRGEGCGVVILKRLSDAIADGDRIEAVIRGTAVNHDGRSSGLTAPNGPAQEAVMRQALASAGVRPHQIGFLEAHGTGTSLGDPIEVRALCNVMREGRTTQRPLLLGSVKSNIGHLEAAAGMAGLIKAILVLQHGEVPPQLHYKKLNPYISFDGMPVQIPTRQTPWPSHGEKRLAGVSAYAFSGTNAHVVIEEPPRAACVRPDVDRPLHVLSLSAKNETALAELARRFENHLQAHPSLACADLCFAAGTGRAHSGHRLAIVADDPQRLHNSLIAFNTGRSAAGVHVSAGEMRRSPQIVFLFTGQGSQSAGMGRELYKTQPTFRKALDECATLLEGQLEHRLLDVLFDVGGQGQLLNQTAYTQPALFAIEYSLVQLWKSWGIEPAAVMGHSVGEYVAACVAGVFSLGDGLRLIAARARLMQALPAGGQMAAVFAPLDRVSAAVQPFASEVAIATINGPEAVVISGTSDGIREVTRHLAADGFRTQRLIVSHAFHSHLMDPMLDAFEQSARSVTFSEPRIPLVSNLTGTWAEQGMLTEPSYWRRHLREAVLFSAGLKALADQDYSLFVEIGPSPTLLGLAQQCLGREAGTWLPSLRRGASEWQPMLDSLAALYVRGAPVNWTGFDADYTRRRIAVPTYPFQREHYWIPLAGSPMVAAAGLPDTAPKPQTTPELERLPSAASLKTIAEDSQVVSNGPLAISNSSLAAVMSDGATQSTANSPVLHPLLHRRLPLPLKERVFETHLGVAAIPYLGDHKVYSAIILPGAGFLEMALAAGRQMFAATSSSATLCVTDVTLKKPLVLTVDETKSLQIVITPDENQSARFEIVSLDTPTTAKNHHAENIHSEIQESAEPSYTTHTKGRISRTDNPRPSHNIDRSQVQAACPEQYPAGLYYRRLEQQGLEYGPEFQVIRMLHRRDGEAIARLELSPTTLPDASQYLLHPALLDGCFQMVGATFSEGQLGNHVYVPVAVERIEVYQPASGMLWCQARLRPASGKRITMLAADLTLFDDAGQVLAEVTGLRVAQARPEQLMQQSAEQLSNWLYEVQWQTEDASVGPSHGASRNNGEMTTGLPENGTWLLVADQAELGRRLSEQLELRGQNCVTLELGRDFSVTDTGFRVDPVVLEHFDRVFEALLKPGCSPLRGIVHLGATETSALTAEGVETAQVAGCAVALHLVQALSKRHRSAEHCRLWLVTAGAQQLSLSRMNVAQAPLWGLGRVIGLEFPDLRCKCVDLDPQADAEQQLEALLEEVRSPDLEDQILYRDGQRYVARLVRSKSRRGAALNQNDGPVRLEIPQRGTLDNLSLRGVSRQRPGPGEIEIEIYATGLNFRDVLNALGLYPGDPGPLGGECAGRIVAIGEGVEGLSLGDEVLGIASGSFGSYVTTPASLVVKKPVTLSFAEAATIPIAFLTAYYALHKLAAMKRGDRLLLHAASGGVGLAAIQLAQRTGAEIFGTVGSAPKREHLRSLGVAHIMSSRTLDFADEVLQATGGQGIDIVLNSLAGDFIAKSLSVLKPGGKFLEIGKADIWNDQRVAEVKQGVSYNAIALDRMVIEQPELVGSMLQELMPLFVSGELTPLPHRTYALTNVVDAFRFMAQAKHIGKIVVTTAKPDAAEGGIRGPATASNLASAIGANLVRANASYLITGGLGSLGLQVARHLVGRGARCIVLTSRRPATELAARSIAALESMGTRVVVAQADVADSGDIERLRDAMNDLPPLGGVIHAAGVLDDGVLLKQTWSRFQKVFAPKVQGAWNLHAWTESLSLDFFVLFSSAAAVLGSPGQGNYAAANSFLDGLAQFRRARGLPAVSINWGPWADGGMAAQLDASASQRISSGGMHQIKPVQGLQLLDEIMSHDSAQVAVLPVDWEQWRRTYPQLGRLPLLSQLLGKTVSPLSTNTTPHSAAAPDRDRIVALSVDRRQAAAERYLQEQVARIMQIPESRLDINEPLGSMGLDSLMAIELKNVVESGLLIEVPVTTLLEGPSIARLAVEVVAKLSATATAVESTLPALKMDFDRIPAAQSTLDHQLDSTVETSSTSNRAVHHVPHAGGRNGSANANGQAAGETGWPEADLPANQLSTAKSPALNLTVQTVTNGCGPKDDGNTAGAGNTNGLSGPIGHKVPHGHDHANGHDSQNGTGNTSRGSKWLAYYRPQRDPAVRLFCFHYLGGGASAFRQWQDELPADVEVCPVQLPGREGRLQEPAFERMPELIDALSADLRPYFDRPFAFYGHSMGTLVSYELARKCTNDWGMPPAHMFMGAYYPPGMQSRYQVRPEWTDDELMQSVRKMLDAPQIVLSNTEFMKVLLPTIRADLNLIGSYRPSAQQAFDCPITAFGGEDDDEVRPDHLMQWRRYSLRAFQMQTLPGGHLFLLKDQAALVARIHEQLRNSLANSNHANSWMTAPTGVP